MEKLTPFLAVAGLGLTVGALQVGFNKLVQSHKNQIEFEELKNGKKPKFFK